MRGERQRHHALLRCLRLTQYFEHQIIAAFLYNIFLENTLIVPMHKNLTGVLDYATRSATKVETRAIETAVRGIGGGRV